MFAHCVKAIRRDLPSLSEGPVGISLYCTLQDNEKKQKREPKETAEELQECEMVFADF